MLFNTLTDVRLCGGQDSKLSPCLTGFRHTEKRVKNATCGRVFLTKLKCFEML